jgi:aryl-alcohol dehydrogenase (NADP+)
LAAVAHILGGMEKRKLGKSDLEVGVFGLGTMTFGHESDEETSHAILDAYFEAGGSFIDTADVYSRGASEEIIGAGWRSGAVSKGSLSPPRHGSQ